MSGSCNKKRTKKDRMLAEMNTAKNKKRRAARQAKIEAGHAAKASRVSALRRLGTVRRLERRILSGAKGLESVLAKAQASL